MAGTDLGGSGLGVPASDRVAEANFYDQRQDSRQRQNGQQGQERGRKQGESEGDAEGLARRRQVHANPQRSSLFDLLFDEVDATPEIEDRVKDRLKRNVRRSFRRQEAAPAPAPIAPPHAVKPPSAADDLVHVVVPAVETIDPERLIRIAAEDTDDAARDQERVVEARLVASQLRYCLSQHTETARKVSTYLRALLVVTHGHYKPKLVIEV